MWLQGQQTLIRTAFHPLWRSYGHIFWGCFICKKCTNVRLSLLYFIQVVFEAEVRDGPNVAVAIDDISFLNCDLSNNPFPVGSTPFPGTTRAPCPIATDFQCGDGQCIPGDQLCDFITQCVNQMDELYCGKGHRSKVKYDYIH